MIYTATFTHTVTANIDIEADTVTAAHTIAADMIGTDDLMAAFADNEWHSNVEYTVNCKKFLDFSFDDNGNGTANLNGYGFEADINGNAWIFAPELNIVNSAHFERFPDSLEWLELKARQLFPNG